MSSFAQIPTDLICRFGELTKTEIIVLGYLYAKRNTKTGQCNPSKAAIGRAVGVARPHVSRAVASLQSAGWLRESEGNFELMEEPKKRTNLVTPERTSTGTPTVPISSHERTNLVTEAYQNEHAYIRIEHTKNIEGNIELNREEAPASATSIFLEIFPSQHLNFYQQDLVADRVSDLTRWRGVLTEWRTNGWQARNLTGMLERYDTFTDREKKYGKPSTDNKPSRSTADTLASIGATPAKL